MRRSVYTLSLFLGFLSGISVVSLAETPVFPGLGYIILSLLFLSCIWRHTQARVAIIVCCIGILLGAARTLASVPDEGPENLSYYHNLGSNTFNGVVSSEPDVRSTMTKLTVEVQGIFHGNAWKKIDGLVLISTDKYPEFFYGDRVEFTGRVEPPGDYQDFSYSDYLARFGIYSILNRPRMTLVERGRGNIVQSLLYHAKRFVEHRINVLLPEPHASFLAGLLTGSRRTIPASVLEQFQITGLTHIIAISGYNITLIIVIMSGLLSKFRRSTQIIVSICVITGFTIFVGASAAVVRASIMGIVGLIALGCQRMITTFIHILCAACVMCMWNPLILWHDIGFQLSFSAVAGLAFVSPILSRWAVSLPSAFGIRESLIMTMSAQLTSTPIILYHFHRVSLISPLANLFVAPAIPLAMLGGTVIVLVGSVAEIIGRVFSVVAWLPLSYILGISEFLSGVPLASISDIEWGIGATLIWYVVLIGGIAWSNRIYKRKSVGTETSVVD